jgi:hypothetical protein
MTASSSSPSALRVKRLNVPDKKTSTHNKSSTFAGCCEMPATERSSRKPRTRVRRFERRTIGCSGPTEPSSGRCRPAVALFRIGARFHRRLRCLNAPCNHRCLYSVINASSLTMPILRCHARNGRSLQQTRDRPIVDRLQGVDSSLHRPAEPHRRNARIRTFASSVGTAFRCMMRCERCTSPQ